MTAPAGGSSGSAEQVRREQARIRTKAGREKAADRARYGSGSLPGFACPKCGRDLHPIRPLSAKRSGYVYFQCHPRCGYRRTLPWGEATARLEAGRQAGVTRVVLD
jgi:hypothetical protein